MGDEAGSDHNAAVLVVDDDPDLRLTIQWVLEDEGFQVVTASDGREALDRSRRHRPSLVVLDMGLPVVDGFGVAAGLQETYGGAVPILVVTADGRAAEKAARVGAFAYLKKPFDLDALIASVQRGLA
jgi:CheY-like chemotaxis protein